MDADQSTSQIIKDECAITRRRRQNLESKKRWLAKQTPEALAQFRAAESLARRLRDDRLPPEVKEARRQAMCAKHRELYARRKAEALARQENGETLSADEQAALDERKKVVAARTRERYYRVKREATAKKKQLTPLDQAIESIQMDEQSSNLSTLVDDTQLVTIDHSDILNEIQMAEFEGSQLNEGQEAKAVDAPLVQRVQDAKIPLAQDRTDEVIHMEFIQIDDHGVSTVVNNTQVPKINNAIGPNASKTRIANEAKPRFNTKQTIEKTQQTSTVSRQQHSSEARFVQDRLNQAMDVIDLVDDDNQIAEEEYPIPKKKRSNNLAHKEQWYAKQTPEMLSKRRAAETLAKQLKRQQLTPEQNEARLRAMAEYSRKRQKNRIRIRDDPKSLRTLAKELREHDTISVKEIEDFSPKKVGPKLHVRTPMDGRAAVANVEPEYGNHISKSNVPTCAVNGCCSDLDMHGVQLFAFPTWLSKRHVEAQMQLAKKRRTAWLKALGLSMSDFVRLEVEGGCRVCSKHFHKGQPAAHIDVDDPDWIPKITLSVENSKGSTSELSSDDEDGPTDYDHAFAEGTCRGCSKVSTANVSLFRAGSKELTTPGSFLAQCLAMDIRFGDGYPSSICQLCIKQLDSYAAFNEGLLRMHQQFTRKLDRNKAVLEALYGPNSEESDNVETIEKQVQVSENIMTTKEHVRDSENVKTSEKHVQESVSIETSEEHVQESETTEDHLQTSIETNEKQVQLETIETSEEYVQNSVNNVASGERSNSETIETRKEHIQGSKTIKTSSNHAKESENMDTGEGHVKVEVPDERYDVILEEYIGIEPADIRRTIMPSYASMATGSDDD